MRLLLLLLVSVPVSSSLSQFRQRSSLPERPDYAQRGRHSSNLRRVPSTSLRRHPRRQVGAPSTIGDDQQNKYLTTIVVGDQRLNVELDTGSSDLYVLQTGFQCYRDYDNSSRTFTEPTNYTYCNPGPTYSIDAYFQPIPELYELTCYGSGKPTFRCNYGPYGNVTVQLNGINVPNQAVAAPNKSSNPVQGLPEYSGILGMAFSAGTRAFRTEDNSATHYSPTMQTLFDTNNIPKLFSLALSRDISQNNNGGLFTIGGIPTLSDPAVNVTNTLSSTTPIQLFPNASTTELSFYSITIDNYIFNSSTHFPNTSTIVDSGYNGLEVPAGLAALTDQAWSPPGNKTGAYLYLDCDAKLTAPFGVTIGGAAYYIQGQDLLGKMANGSCYSLFYAGLPPNGYSLGDPLLKNTLAVFDWGKTQMQFYARTEYES